MKLDPRTCREEHEKNTYEDFCLEAREPTPDTTFWYRLNACRSIDLITEEQRKYVSDIYFLSHK